jgi:hypothetical protein
VRDIAPGGIHCLGLTGNWPSLTHTHTHTHPLSFKIFNLFITIWWSEYKRMIY